MPFLWLLTALVMKKTHLPPSEEWKPLPACKGRKMVKELKEDRILSIFFWLMDIDTGLPSPLTYISLSLTDENPISWYL